MKRTKQIITIVLCSLVLVIGVYALFDRYGGFFRASYNDLKNTIDGKDESYNYKTDESGNIITDEWGKPVVEEFVSREHSVPEYTYKDSLSYEDYEEYRRLIAEALDPDINDFYDLVQTTEDNLKALYNKDFGNKQKNAVTVSYHGEQILYKIDNCYSVKSFEMLGLSDASQLIVDKNNVAFDEEGILKEGFSYIVMETTVTNKSGHTISEYLSNGFGSIMFFNDKGEHFWSVRPVYISLMPGEGTKLYVYNDFLANQSLKSTYIFAVPDSAFAYFTACLVLNPANDSMYWPQNVSMLVLDELQKTIVDS